MKRATVAKLASVVIGGAILVQANVAFANRYVNNIRGQLLAAAVLAGIGGAELTHEPSINVTNHNTYKIVTFNLRRGYTYHILGVCDQDCRDLDLKLYDENGNLLVQDTRNDDTPWVKVTPRWTGAFAVRVEMHSCYDNPCYYGVGIFGN